MTDIRKASADAIEAAKQGDQYAAILAALAAADIVKQLQQPAPVVVQQPQGGAGKWIAITVGGSVFMVGFAFAAVALAIAAASVALVAVVVYAIWRDVRKR